MDWIVIPALDGYIRFEEKLTGQVLVLVTNPERPRRREYRLVKDERTTFTELTRGLE